MTAGRGGSTRRWRRTRLLVLERDGWTCQVPTASGQLCGVRLTTTDPRLPTHAHVDHRTDWADGGTDAPENLRAACALCNQRRAAARTNTPPPVVTTTTW